MTPDREAIRRDLEYMTRRWSELDEPAQFEVRAFGEGKNRQTALFKADWIDEAVDWIANMNALRFNCYVVRNPIRMSVTRSASDTDIIASYFLWADCDEPAAAGNVQRFDGPKWSANVTTGRTPATRVHVYWELDVPCTDLGAWRQLQSDIAAHFKSDPSVINPSRIMRIGGTVNWPAAHKRAKGYVDELCTMRTEYSDARSPVSFDQMRRVFPTQAASRLSEAASFTIDPGKPALDRERTRIQALAGQEWHNAVIRLVASYVSRGLTDDEIHSLTDALTLAGYTVEQTRREVQTAIDGARRKGWTPDAYAAPAEMTPEEKEAIPAALFKPWERKDLSAIPYPEFVYSDFYARGYTSLTLAAPKVGKSMLGLAEALDMATGRGFLTGTAREPLRVVYYNAEDDQNVLNARVAALLTEYRIDQGEIEGRFWPVSGVEAEGFYMIQGEKGVINEALFVALEKFCAEERADVLIFDPLQDLSSSPETNEVFRMLGARIRRMATSCRVSVGLIHHTRKVAPGMSATIDDARGGSSLRGTSRFNRVLNPMTEDEAIKAGVENHRFYFRVGDMESNLAPPSAEVNRWFEKRSVICPNGQSIGAIAPWQWPDAFAGLSPDDARKVQIAIAAAQEPPRHNPQSAAWAGRIVGEVVGLDPDEKGDKARIQALIKGWLQTGVLTVEETRDTRNGRDVKVIAAGPNNPKAETQQ